MVVTNSMNMGTLPLGIVLLQDYHTMNLTQTMAAPTIAALPILILLLFMQRQFIEGLSAGVVEG